MYIWESLFTMPVKKETTIEEALLIAAQNGDLDKMKLLLEERPDVNHQAKVCSVTLIALL